MTVKYILGEDKYVKLLLHSPKNEPFEVESAMYELSTGNQVESTGSATVDGHYISMKLSPKTRGFYKLTVTYAVADTVRKVKIDVYVE